MLTAAVSDEADRQRRHEADAPVPHRQHDDVAAEHGEGAMREVDEAHQPHGDGQADRDDEQHHAGGHARRAACWRCFDAEDHGAVPTGMPRSRRRAQARHRNPPEPVRPAVIAQIVRRKPQTAKRRPSSRVASNAKPPPVAGRRLCMSIARSRIRRRARSSAPCRRPSRCRSCRSPSGAACRPCPSPPRTDTRS